MDKEFEKNKSVPFQENMTWGKEVLQKTASETWNLFENEQNISSVGYIIKKLKELNPNVEIKAFIDKGIIFASVSVEDLKLPDWFYLSNINWITNKNVEQSWTFISINVYPLRYHPSYN